MDEVRADRHLDPRPPGVAGTPLVARQVWNGAPAHCPQVLGHQKPSRHLKPEHGDPEVDYQSFFFFH